MFDFTTDETRQLESDLKTFHERAFPFATNATINRAAFSGRDVAQAFVKGKMIQRNAWTLSSIRVEKSRTLNVSQQAATLGSTEDYMERQEFGAVLRSKGRHGRAIPTPYSSGETALPRRRLPRRPNAMSRIQLRGSLGDVRGGRKARNAAAVRQAAERKGSRFVFLDLGRRSGIYRVLGGKRKPRIKKVWDLSRKTVRVPARPWLLPATQKVSKELPRYYADALRYQLRRHGALGL